MKNVIGLFLGFITYNIVLQALTILMTILFGILGQILGISFIGAIIMMFALSILYELSFQFTIYPVIMFINKKYPLLILYLYFFIYLIYNQVLLFKGNGFGLWYILPGIGFALQIAHSFFLCLSSDPHSLNPHDELTEYAREHNISFEEYADAEQELNLQRKSMTKISTAIFFVEILLSSVIIYYLS